MRAVLNHRDVRRSMRRLVAACLAVAMFAASGGAALLGEVCTHHGGGAAGDAHDGHAEAAAAGPAGHHAPASGHEAGAAQPDSPHGDDGECTCLGPCQTAATVLAGSVDGDVVRVPAPEYVLVPASPSFDLVPRASQATWFLPPGNGPPALT